MVVFCPRHRIGYNTELDPVCPQCSIGRMEPPLPVRQLAELALAPEAAPISSEGTNGTLGQPADRVSARRAR